MHDWPFVPHDVASVPVRQRSPTQQPAQFVESQRVLLHERVPVSHERPCDAQSMQEEPLRPHAKASTPARHAEVPPWKLQHPVEQFAELQFVTLRPQTPLPLQNWKPFATQSLQRAPKRPQARTSLPVRHVPLVSQQPDGQFAALQLPGPASTPPSVVSISRLERPHPDAVRAKTRATQNARLKKRASEERMRKASRWRA